MRKNREHWPHLCEEAVNAVSAASWLFWVSVGLAVAIVVGTWTFSWRYVAAMVNDVYTAWRAQRRKDYDAMTTHIERANWRMTGCAVAALALVLVECSVMAGLLVAAIAHMSTH